MKITLSGIKADIGSIGGHTRPTDEVLKTVEDFVRDNGVNKNMLLDFYIGYTGDDIHILMSHQKGVDDEGIHKLAWDAFISGTEKAREQGLYGAGQDMLKDSFSGNIKGMGPGVAELEFEERPSEPFVLITADKTEPGCFNYPLYKLFCEPSSNSGLLLNPPLTEGVVFSIMDVKSGEIAKLKMPEDLFLIATVLMYPGRYVVDSVNSSDGKPIVSATTSRLHNIAGKYVGKDDPLALIRLQKDFPATEEACSVFKTAHYVAGNTRGSHHLPLMPVKRMTPATANYCIPIVSAVLFCVHKGMFTSFTDAFDTPDWDYFRNKATEKAEYMREQGFMHPATLIPEELEYNEGYQSIMSTIKARFKTPSSE